MAAKPSSVVQKEINARKDYEGACKPAGTVPEPIEQTVQIPKNATAQQLNNIGTQGTQLLVAGNSKLNLAFVAYLFNQHPSLDLREQDDVEIRRKREEELQQIMAMKLKAEDARVTLAAQL